MYRSTFRISKMDCPSEEQLIRMKLAGVETIHSLEFDLAGRLLHVIHQNGREEITHRLNGLKLDTTLVESVAMELFSPPVAQHTERRTLQAVLMINLTFFVLEIVTGLISRSMGLVADSLDMLADSIVYALALIAVGGTVAAKKNTAKFAGYFQFILAFTGFAEALRRFFLAEAMPDFRTMIVVSILALIANASCLYLLQRNKSREVHMKATMIFTSNDIIINAGVIGAGLMVYWFNSGYPDLVVGAVVFMIVARGAFRILRLSRQISTV
jgi:Co/Zn/Cd efflux system component